MARCAHVQWIELDGLDPHWAIIDPHRWRSLLHELEHPKTQFPAVVLFLGGRRKAAMLRNMFPENNFGRRNTYGIANLSIDNISARSTYPTMIADSTIGAHVANQIGSWYTCHESTRWKICTEGAILKRELTLYALTSLIRPHCHCVCMFVDDFGDVDSCHRYVSSWLGRAISKIECRPSMTPPLVLVTSTRSGLDELRSLETLPGFLKTFHSLHVLFVDPHAYNASSLALHNKIKVLLDSRREFLAERGMLLNAEHSARVFEHAIEDFCLTPKVSTDILTGYRHPGLDVGPRVGVMVGGLLSTKTPVGALSVLDMSQFVASALLLHAYPPEHHRFAATLLFETLFEKDLLDVAEYGTDDHGLDIDGTRESFCTLSKLLSDCCSASSIRKQVLGKLAPQMQRWKSDTICLICLSCRPEHVIQCGHAICDVCLRRYCTGTGNGYTYLVVHCPVCGRLAGRTAKLKPPTSAPNMLAIDGGGVRGIISLELLLRLEGWLDVPYPVWHFFDLVVGTSAGGLIALDLLVSGASISTSMYRFEDLATRVFRLPAHRCCRLCRHLYNFMTWIFSDSKHDSVALEQVLMEVFGSNSSLFDSVTQSASNTKIGIMATTVSTSQLRIFTNYNGIDRNTRAANYAILRKACSGSEPKIWEVARCTTAAPGYFTPMTLADFGPLQDGGMRANNPTEAGLWELGCIWPSTPKPSVVLSVGTGCEGAPTHELSQKRGFWLNSFLPRIIRAFLSSPCLHGQNSWLALMNRLDEADKGSFMRLNVEFEHQEPALDDIQQAPALHALGQTAAIDFVPYRDRIWASAFFIELAEHPGFHLGRHLCRAVIRSRFNDARPLIKAMHRAYPKPAIIIDQALVLPLNSVECCMRCGSLSLEVKFDIRRLSEPIEVQIRFCEGLTYTISGMPCSVAALALRQAQWTMYSGGLWTLPAAACCSRPPKRRRTTTSRGSKKKLKPTICSGVSYE